MAHNKLSNYATTVSTSESGNMIVTYHSTVIVEWSNTQITLRTDGYETVTTKRKMNQASLQFNLGYRVFQDDFTWYVVYKGETKLFKDGMIFTR
jgi:hypothetical protein